jgi:hypothetical protein
MIELLTTPKNLADQLPVFATEAFLSAKSREYGWFSSPDFVLPFFIDRRLCFSRLVFTTETIPLNPGTTVEAETEFLDAVTALCRGGKKISADFIATAQANSVFRTAPRGSERLPWGSYVVDLCQPEAAVFARFHPKHRNKIRNADSQGAIVSTTSDTHLVHDILKQTMIRQNLLFYPSVPYLEALQRNLKEHITLYVAKQGDQPQGTAIVVHNHLGGFYYYGGSIPRPATGSLNFMQFEIMKDLQRKNVPVYDLMGARIDTGGDEKLEGIQHFKSRFASGMRQGYCFRSILHPMRHRLFLCTARSYFMLRGSRYTGDVIDQAKQVCNADAKMPTAFEGR